MIRIIVLYPSREGATFDMAYYLGKHLPLVEQLFSPALKGLSRPRSLPIRIGSWGTSRITPTSSR
jgi:hypothetical protein